MLTCLGAKIKDDVVVVLVVQQINVMDEKLRCA